MIECLLYNVSLQEKERKRDKNKKIKKKTDAGLYIGLGSDRNMTRIETLRFYNNNKKKRKEFTTFATGLPHRTRTHTQG
jgi:hypothetical protein